MELKQQESFNQNERQFENVLTCWYACGAVHQNGIGSNKIEKQNAVAHQVDPKSEDFGSACIVVPVFVRVGSRVRQSISCHFSALP